MNKDVGEGTTGTVTGSAGQEPGNRSGVPTPPAVSAAMGAKHQAADELHGTIAAFKQVGKDITAGVKDGVDAARRDA